MFSVYWSPSTQEHNQGAIPGYIEEKEMNLIIDEVVVIMKDYPQVQNFRNKPEMTLTQIFADSNKHHIDAHVALHSNSGGGLGAEAWAFSPNFAGWKLAEDIYKFVQPIRNSTRGVKAGGTNYGELGKVIAPSCIIEIDFHDNPERAKYIQEHRREYAIAIVKGVLEFLGIPYKAPQAPTSPQPTTPSQIPYADLIAQRDDLINQRNGLLFKQEELSGEIDTLKSTIKTLNYEIQTYQAYYTQLKNFYNNLKL